MPEITLGAAVVQGVIQSNGLNANLINGATVTFSANGNSASVQTNWLGRYEIGLPSTGIYSISAAASGYSSTTATVTISSLDSSSTVNLTNMAPFANVPANVGTYFELLITNPYSSATPANYNQMLVLNSNSLSAYEAADLSNIEFFYANGTIVYSWLENGSTSYSTASTYWLLLYQSIPAHSSMVIFVGFAPPNHSFFTTPLGPTGEAPQLSHTYGAYDNGPVVFPLYISGDTPSTATTFSVYNGLTLSPVADVPYGGTAVNALYLSGTDSPHTRAPGFIYQASVTSNYLSEAYLLEYNWFNAGQNQIGADIMDSASASSTNINAIGVITGSPDASPAFNMEIVQYGSWSTTNNLGTNIGYRWQFGSVLSTPGNFYGTLGPTPGSNSAAYSGSTSNNPVVTSSSLYIGAFYADADGASSSAYYNYIKLCRVPLLDHMPTVQGPMTITGWDHLTASNNQNANTANPFQLYLDFNASSYKAIENSGLSNVEFVQTNGSVLSSWLEGGSSTSTNAIFWLRTPAIDAYSSMDIYVIFVGTGSNVMNGISIGESPLLSYPYASLDNGRFVFNFYDNFSGGTLNMNNWFYWGSNSRSNLYISDGLYFNTPGQYNTGYGVSSHLNFSDTTTFDFYGQPVLSNGNPYSAAQDGFGDLGTTDVPGIGNPSIYAYASFPFDSGGNGGGQTNYGNNFGVWTTERDGANAWQFYNYADQYTTTSAATSLDSVKWVYQGLSTVGSVYWARVRSTPPNGVMPTVANYGSNGGNGGNHGGGGCVLYGTNITLANDSMIQVQNLMPGMNVLSYNPNTAQLVTTTVANVTVSQVSLIVEVDGLVFISGLHDQPVFVMFQNGTEGWVVLGKLNYSMKLYYPVNDTWMPIDSLVPYQGNFTVFDVVTARFFNSGGVVRGDYIANGFLLDIKTG